ncbi:MAG: prepilin-type N-terminal cleavage/methylation domain-containing protein [Dehalococcoidales bacterium]|nr:prepilin-type N-terminal cleavage/methylation domain-containing protein [Dehalococcoidales bacterium]
MRKQRGFTLVELLVATAITGMLMSILSPISYEINNVTQYSHDRTEALHELQNAAYWFNYDGQMAVSAAGNASMTFTLPSAQVVTYAVSNAKLTRTSGTTVTTIAQNISALTFTTSGRLVTMNITATPIGRQNVAEQGTYAVNLRVVP